MTVGLPFPEQDHAILFASISLNCQWGSGGMGEDAGLSRAIMGMAARHDTAMAIAHAFIRLSVPAMFNARRHHAKRGIKPKRSFHAPARPPRRHRGPENRRLPCGRVTMPRDRRTARGPR
jgi:hypothetical protein